VYTFGAGGGVGTNGCSGAGVSACVQATMANKATPPKKEINLVMMNFLSHQK
jgi:hypothetical protein